MTRESAEMKQLEVLFILAASQKIFLDEFLIQISIVQFELIKLMFVIFLTSQSVYQTIIIHTLPNIPQTKGNRTMKVGPLLE